MHLPATVSFVFVKTYLAIKTNSDSARNFYKHPQGFLNVIFKVKRVTIIGYNIILSEINEQ